MRLILQLALVLLTSVFSIKLYSQEKQLLESLPSTKEEFIKSESSVINTIEWLENTALDKEPEKRKLYNANLMAWITNSPTVTISISTKTTPMSKRNPDLLLLFMAGWTKYSLQNNYSKDLVKCNVAGLKSAIKIYKAGIGIKKDKEIEKLVDLDEKNELESWVAKQLSMN